MVRGIPVLVYHRIGVPPPGAPHPDTYVLPRAFSRQMALLSALGWRGISLGEYAERRAAGRAPARELLITFDDGSETVLSQAAPVLRARGFKAALFMVSSRMGGPAVWDGEDERSGHRQLTAGELRRLAGEGWDIGSHTATHPRLTGQGGEAVEAELRASKRELEALLGREVRWLAYPFGDYDATVRGLAREAGYEGAFATERGDGDAFSIPRRIVSGRDGLLKFGRRVLQAKGLAAR